MVRFYIQKGTHRGLFRSVQKTLKFFQTFALLEVIHCAIGIVRTSVLVTGVQVSSRIFMVWFIAHSIKQIQNEESVILFLVVWTVTEITRYSFYTFNLLNHLPYFIKWARYNFFIILYPAGVAGELLTIYAALPYVKKTGMFSLRLPNKYNVSFDYYYFLIIVMFSYVPLFPQLYFHMLRQRRRVLHGEAVLWRQTLCQMLPVRTGGAHICPGTPSPHLSLLPPSGQPGIDIESQNMSTTVGSVESH
ncbi:hypothetical protein IHE44_0000212 [Lamprotornis superbus]|uniref:Very-long-chain (3R)-3-hydroxyacyl-CoA dehydratase n=1 Tax=Lamprotornis superbus TaxID=245042 RepID=A0A835P389_9PASS|nr:hypothetical protein IHE44_0000212 [Lamprotornis superbus]